MLLNDKVCFRMQWPQYADLQVNGMAIDSQTMIYDFFILIYFNFELWSFRGSFTGHVSGKCKYIH